MATISGATQIDTATVLASPASATTAVFPPDVGLCIILCQNIAFGVRKNGGLTLDSVTCCNYLCDLGQLLSLPETVQSFV